MASIRVTLSVRASIVASYSRVRVRVRVTGNKPARLGSGLEVMGLRDWASGLGLGLDSRPRATATGWNYKHGMLKGSH